MVSVARERALLAPLGMRTRQQWGATGKYLDARTVVEPAQAFFLHVAVVADPGDLVGTEDRVAQAIERIGWARFPATGISYNALAFNSGRLYEGQPLGRRGAHTYNDKHRRTCSEPGCPNRGRALPRGGSDGWNLNYTVRALCLPQMHTVPVTDAQVENAARWAARLITTGLATRDARWHGHRCVAWKDCPGNPAWKRLPEIQRSTDLMVKKPAAQPKPKPAQPTIPAVEEPHVITPEDIAAIAKASAKATVQEDVRRGPDVWPLHLTLANAGADAKEARAIATRVEQHVLDLNRTVQALTDAVSALAAAGAAPVVVGGTPATPLDVSGGSSTGP
jgi:hypothetical protein